MFCYLNEIYMNDYFMLISRNIVITNSVYIFKLLKACFKC